MPDATDNAILERRCARAPDSLTFRKLCKCIIGQTRGTQETYGTVMPVDRWVGWLSSGKDSYMLRASLFDFTGLAIGAASPYTGSENP